jgi:predicted nucleotidyltransferase
MFLLVAHKARVLAFKPGTQMSNKKQYLKAPEKDDIISTIFSHLQREHKEIAAAYLFGSFVKEEAFSDIDLGILMNIDLERPLEYELDLESRLEKVLKYPVDVRIINGAPLSFCQNVIRHGRVIVDSDPNLRADFEGQILKQYFDFARFRRQYLTEVKNAPV